MEYSTWESKKSSWSARERRARSTVRTPFVILYIIRPKSSGRVTHYSHKLQTKAMHHSTRHYMNRIENFNRISRFTYRCCVYCTQPSSLLLGLHCRHSRAARATPSSKDTPAATVRSCAATRIHSCIARTEYEAVQAATRSADRHIRYSLFGCAHCVG